MSTTEPDGPDTLVKALVRVQANMPTVNKGKTAKVKMKSGGEYSYKYADLADVVDALYPLMAEQGLAFTARPTLNAEGRFVLDYSLMHVTGGTVSGEYPLPDPNDRPSQEVGSAITYARRYSLCSVVGLIPDEDDDAQVAQGGHTSRSGGKPKAQTSARQSQPQPSRTVDAETGEITEAPDVPAAIDKLDQDGRKRLQERMTQANFPPVDKLPTAAARQVIKWAGEIKEARNKGAPFE